MSEVPEGARKPKPLLIVLVVGAVLVVCLGAAVVAGLFAFLPVRQEITEVQEPHATVDEPAGGVAEPTADTIEAEAQAVAALIMTSSSGWAAHITGVETTTVLRRPVIVVATDIGPEQANLSDELSSALASFASGLTAEDGSYYTFYIQILSSEGDLIGAVDSTDDRWRLDTPSAPGDPVALYSWLDTVYGSAAPEPEVWMQRITGISGGPSDPDGYVVVNTDLDPDRLADQQAAQTIIDAVNSSGATFAPGVRVIFGDGTFEWSSLLDGTDPYGP